MEESLKPLTPEERLLITLCRISLTEKQKREIGNLIKEIRDWDNFVRMSNEHGVIALCWYNINRLGKNNKIPYKISEILHSAYLKNLTRNAFLFKQLDEVALLATKYGIRIVLLKGLALEKTVYGNRGLRQMTDIDILVRKEDAALMRKILLQDGTLLPMHRGESPH